MVELVNITKLYHKKPVVNDVSLFVPRGQTLVLLGKSGSGKTTLLKMINRLIEPDKGSILIDGENITNRPVEELRRNIGFVIQAIGLFPHWTVAQNIATVPTLIDWSKDKISSRVSELLEHMGLPLHFASRYPHELSGGQQQRIGVARALAANPSLLLMDEPFGALDPIIRKEIQSDFQHLGIFKEVTKIVVTHDVKEAFYLGDEVALIDEGRVIEKATPRNLLFNSISDLVRSFIGEDAWSLKLSEIALSEVIAFLPLTESYADEVLICHTDEKPFSRVFSLTNSDHQQVKIVDNSGLVGHASVADLKASFLKLESQLAVH
ncbi:ABC transporter ATP-binding protein [Imperialibacter roseus]|uniref:ABC transporter ATP-binding protein n=1 Tax=Imperialibacter roseus TaxID=1324217 RepID=A0ABZ0IYJ1_9BACT|nr:ABC transporter ATP-binding protein [Imperialibacter roseus]WOK08736.1 ABC transporter ATP-binding protein [Imperialibacter roseus]